MTKDNQLADGHIYVYSTSGPERQTVKVLQGMEMIRTKKWSGEPWEDPSDGWDREKPRYKLTRTLEPMLNRRRFETPLSSDELGHWQYAERVYREGEEIECLNWPHASMAPLNRSAKAIHRYFMETPRVSMDSSPWRDGRVCLPDMTLRTAQIKRPSEFHQPDAA